MGYCKTLGKCYGVSRKNYNFAIALKQKCITFNPQKNTKIEKIHFRVFGAERGIRTPGNSRFNGFQDFLRNPTLTQNNRKYQTVENAENPDVARAFGVLSFQKSKTSGSARISASKTISKVFLEKVLDKSAPTSPVASHV